MLPVRLSLLAIDGQNVVGTLLRLIELDVASVPHEVLEEFVCVFLGNDQASSLDDVASVLDELAAIGRELGLVDGGVVEDILERTVDLFVIRVATVAEGLDHTEETNLYSGGWRSEEPKRMDDV